MNRKTYLNKTNTIVYNSNFNTSQNPVSELYYGNGYSRILIQIDTSKIAEMVNDKTFPDIDKLKHVLRMKNCWGLQSIDSKLLSNSGKNSMKERTSSFDIHLVRLPTQWDSGSGNDFTKDGFITKNYSVSTNGSNWFNSKTNVKWDIPGVYTGVTHGNENIITTQHFNVGNEDVEMDITNEINDIISGVRANNGFMLMFDHNMENMKTSITQYVGFFTDKTTTFFKPYMETIYSDTIVDDRGDFYLDKDNKLYFYSIINGEYTNLDHKPICAVNGVDYDVKQATKGVYYININLPSNTNDSDVMLYDIWSNIVYNGKRFDDVEMEFVTKKETDFFSFGNSGMEQPKYVPTVYGIKNEEMLNMGQTINILISPRERYTLNVVKHITDMEYRIYVKETNKEITVIDYLPVNRAYNRNYFTLYTGDLLPNQYYVDIRINRNGEIVTHKNKLSFKIINEL